MKNFPIEKYKFYQFKNPNDGITISAVSTYGGKTVKGYAKCNPEDVFDEEKGKKLASLRCGRKIAKKRLLRAAKKFMEAAAVADEATIHYNKMKQYYMDAVDQYDEAGMAIKELLKELE